ncbi:MAG TPA: PIN domain-containing protein [Desulfuromonadaceae bacterium]
MKQRIFIDTNIIVDIFCHREPFYTSAAILLSLIEKGKIVAFASSLTYANLHYVLRKTIGSRQATEALKNLRKIVAILPVGDTVIAHALESSFRDFEDSIQYHTALENNISYLVTRNQRDFRLSAITVGTAEEFLAQLSA